MSLDLLTTVEAAKIVRLSPAALTSFRKSSGGPAFVKLGGRIFYTIEDLEAWVASCRKTAGDSDKGSGEKGKLVDLYPKEKITE